MTEAVIVVHGLWLPGIETKLLRHRLQVAGFEVQLFRFATLRGTLEQNVAKLARCAEATPGERLHFVGYSLGGVITLSLLAESMPERTGRIVCLGAPLTGSGTAAKLARTSFGRRLIGRSLVEHVRRGGIGAWAGERELGIIAGTVSLGVGRLFRQPQESNDGTVTVAETRLPGAREHLTLPVTHTQMLFDATVARQTIHFLRHGQFARQTNRPIRSPIAGGLESP
jgi:pimeloyl-ACP methyl ester carboxylesterase